MYEIDQKTPEQLAREPFQYGAHVMLHVKNTYVHCKWGTRDTLWADYEQFNQHIGGGHALNAPVWERALKGLWSWH